MSGIECKVLICVCSAAQAIERGGALLFYRAMKGEPVNTHAAICSRSEMKTVEIYDILHQATGLAILPEKISLESLPVVMRHGYEAIIANDEKFTQEQLLEVIDHGNKG